MCHAVRHPLPPCSLTLIALILCAQPSCARYQLGGATPPERARPVRVLTVTLPPEHELAASRLTLTLVERVSECGAPLARWGTSPSPGAPDEPLLRCAITQLDELGFGQAARLQAHAQCTLEAGADTQRAAGEHVEAWQLGAAPTESLRQLRERAALSALVRAACALSYPLAPQPLDETSHHGQASPQ